MSSPIGDGIRYYMALWQSHWCGDSNRTINH